MSLKVKVVYFHTLRDLAGVGEETLELADGATIAELVGAAKERHPRLAETLAGGSGWLMIAQNQEYAQLDEPVVDGAEVALMPPVSGG